MKNIYVFFLTMFDEKTMLDEKELITTSTSKYRTKLQKQQNKMAG